MSLSSAAKFTCLLLVALVGANILASQSIALAKADELLQLSSILPKLEAIHEDSNNLQIKNRELHKKILIGMKAQVEAKLKLANQQHAPGELPVGQPPIGVQPAGRPVATNPTSAASTTTTATGNNDNIDYAELEEFNKWVQANLDYAVKNTQASIEALKEEASQNSGMVDYTEQAIRDGIEGVKYWQSAVIFQDKTLKNEPYDELQL